MSQLKQNTSDLDTLIAKANTLPDAGSSEDLTAVLNAQEQLITELEAELEGKASGSGGGAVETCTVNIVFEGSGRNALDISEILYESKDGLTTETHEREYTGNWVISGCRCDSILCIIAGQGKYNMEYISGMCTISGDARVIQCEHGNVVVIIHVRGSQDDVITVEIPVESDF